MYKKKNNIIMAQQGSLLEAILEKTSNTEYYTNSSIVREKLNEALKTMSKREKLVRETTIMFKLSTDITSTRITDLVEIKYCNSNSKPSASYWYDKEFAYVQFVSFEEKEGFLNWIQLDNSSSSLKDAILPPNDNGEHLQRKPIRLIINNVRGIIKADLIQQSLARILGDQGGPAFNLFREGKANATTGARAIMFNTNEDGFRKIFGTLEGAIPYVSTANNIKTRLYPKVNCKPWACNNCFVFGRHECKGKTCAKCGTSGHVTKECDKTTKYCSNCKQKGHRAKDTHCSFYLGEVAKELRKVCIPIEYFTNKDLRFYFIKHYLQIN